MNRETVMDFYRECYDDAVDKDMGWSYLDVIYNNGDATYEMICEVANNNEITPIGLLCKYRYWQEDEKICELIRDPLKRRSFIKLCDEYNLSLEKSLSLLLNRL